MYFTNFFQLHFKCKEITWNIYFLSHFSWWFRQQKPFYQQCLKKTMAILWQLHHWLATLVLQNWLTTAPVNLQRLVLMRHCVWSSNYLVVTCKPHAFAHILFNQPACLMMSIQGKKKLWQYNIFFQCVPDVNWKKCNSHNHKYFFL